MGLMCFQLALMNIVCRSDAAPSIQKTLVELEKQHVEMDLRLGGARSGPAVQYEGIAATISYRNP